MFSSGPNYNKLKTNLRLAVNRLKLLEKKKTELATKSRKEISDFLAISKPDRARIRVEHIIREDYLVEAMEILEMFCDLLLARFGLVTQLKELDEGISEAVCSVIWVAPRLQADVAELKIVSDLLQTKYGKNFADACRAGVPPANVSEKLQHKMSIQAPPKLLVEKYLIEIAKIYNIDYEPDPQIMKDDQKASTGSDFLIDLNNPNNLGGNISQPGFIGYPQPPSLPIMPQPPANIPFNYPPGPSGGYNNFQGGGGAAHNNYPGAPPNNFPGGPPNNYSGGPPNNYPGGPPNNYPGGSSGGGGMGASFGSYPSAPNFNYNIPPNPEKKDLNTMTNFLNEEKKSEEPPPRYNSLNYSNNNSSLSPDDNIENSGKPKPQPRSKMLPGGSNIPELPNVPSNLPDIPDNQDDSEIDFDDLAKRFEELKKRH